MASSVSGTGDGTRSRLSRLRALRPGYRSRHGDRASREALDSGGVDPDVMRALSAPRRRNLGANRPAPDPEGYRPGSSEPPTVIALDGRSVWRAAWIVMAVMAIGLFIRFFIDDGAPILFNVIMAFFASIAMESAVRPLSRWMPRPVAAALMMILLALMAAGFFVAFGGLLTAQVSALVAQIPPFVEASAAWLQQRWGITIDPGHVASQLGISADTMQSVVLTLAGGAIGVIGNVVSSAFSVFSFLFFTFYLTADLPRLRRWVAELFPPRAQVVVLTIWQLALTKVGGYVAARCVLAAICGSITAAFLAIIGMDYWLPLGIWTGVVAQFVPTVGTYIAIALPVAVGLLGPDPEKGVATLVFALVYQQIENVTIEPRISAAAVKVHPAVSFASAMLGAALFGVSGALVGVPVAATIMAVFDIYKQRYEISAAAAGAAEAAAGGKKTGLADGAERGGGSSAAAPASNTPMTIAEGARAAEHAERRLTRPSAIDEKGSQSHDSGR